MADTPRVYVGTYAKYNDGNLAGEWVDLDGHDADSFEAACRELHSDETDPEFMFQDWEGVPDSMISESSIEPEFWGWLELDEDDRAIVRVYRDHYGSGESASRILECFEGVYLSREDWAERYTDDTGMLESVPEALRYYVDLDSWARDCEINGDMSFIEADGGVYAFHE